MLSRARGVACGLRDYTTLAEDLHRFQAPKSGGSQSPGMSTPCPLLVSSVTAVICTNNTHMYMRTGGDDDGFKRCCPGVEELKSFCIVLGCVK